MCSRVSVILRVGPEQKGNMLEAQLVIRKAIWKKNDFSRNHETRYEFGNNRFFMPYKSYLNRNSANFLPNWNSTRIIRRRSKVNASHFLLSSSQIGASVYILSKHRRSRWYNFQYFLKLVNIYIFHCSVPFSSDISFNLKNLISF